MGRGIDSSHQAKSGKNGGLEDSQRWGSISFWQRASPLPCGRGLLGLPGYVAIPYKIQGVIHIGALSIVINPSPNPRGVELCTHFLKIFNLSGGDE